MFREMVSGEMSLVGRLIVDLKPRENPACDQRPRKHCDDCYGHEKGKGSRGADRIINAGVGADADGPARDEVESGKGIRKAPALCIYIVGHGASALKNRPPGCGGRGSV